MLPKHELDYLQAIRDMNRAVGWGRLTRKTRPRIAAFLEHDDPRIRQRAFEILEPEEADLAELDSFEVVLSDEEPASDGFLVVEDFTRH
ncbi:MAG: hypothetical protein ACAI25_13215 [Planctomycetota bacterium]